MAKIGFEDKVSVTTNGLPEKNKVTAGNINEIKSSVNDLYDITGEKVFIANLTQSSTFSPVVSEITNTIGAIAWTRDAEGIYIGVLAGAFSAVKKTIKLGSSSVSAVINYYFLDADTVKIETKIPVFGALNPSDNVLIDTLIEIKIYE